LNLWTRSLNCRPENINTLARWLHLIEMLKLLSFFPVRHNFDTNLEFILA
jgi:hypothetical protein